MSSLINYLWEGIICLTIPWLLYKALFEKTTFFAWNRTFLLSALILALLFPALNLEGLYIFNFNRETYQFILPTFEYDGTNQPLNSLTPIPITSFLAGAYLIGMLFSIIKFLIRIFSLISSIKKAKISYKGEYTLLEHASFEPSSFFHLIFLPEGSFKLNDKVDCIISHEAMHANYNHSLDKLLLQLVKIIFWFYPICHLYEKDLEVVHEYQVDERMKDIYPLKEYALLLIHLGKPKMMNQLAHNFNKFQIKKRITMMTKPKSKRIAKWLYALALPIFIGLFGLISCDQKDEIVDVEKPQAETKTEGAISNEIFETAEDMPVPFDGMQGWNEYLSQNLKYPQSSKDQNIEGTVYLQFIINKEGELINPSVIRGVDPDLDAEALRVIKNSPKWTAGKQGGRDVNVKMQIPIRFKLNKQLLD
ncbi:M56 family metallopeptidase [Cyclobacterium marinum]|uniref:TonB family protein n=1 Tax=Cyclobacterium marinum (strain ATCC 25205 / DSM 745 / LMG 13164 / NCIMB 1802) TaxID=880070 RepID=G0J4Q4_CYCMS|nr:M56 family metallopeptidase [Cyclobacterium marinum]AEL25284.1 TonB family protein [Cyclobacterium marinum DSM 745]MBR9778037.1 TonB family protein [Cytophagales bacterium]|tara:strand:+ start:35247 stop:36506 length:1260 start_codon:yes stop_codon:yes gene_type:complete